MKVILAYIIIFSFYSANAQIVLPSEIFYTTHQAFIRQNAHQPGMEISPLAKRITVYPNPASSYIWVQVNAEKKSSYRITLFTADGRLYQERDYPIDVGINKIYLLLPAEDFLVSLLLKMEDLQGPQTLTLRILRQ